MESNSLDEGLPTATPTASASPAPLPPPAFADGSARRLEPGWIPANRFGGLIFWGIFGAFVSGVLLTAFVAGKVATPKFLIAGGVIVAVFGSALLLSALWPTWEHARAGYRILPDRIESWSGVLWRRTVSVPISRVQYTDVKQGPLQRHYGIATLVVHTAGTVSSDVSFQGLPPALAGEVRDWLVAQTGSDAV